MFKIGQTMVEYALIIAAVGMLAFGTYRVMGNSISSIGNGISSSLTSA